MSIVVYSNGVMASDSLVVTNGTREGEVEKIFRMEKNGIVSLFGMVGDMNKLTLFREWVESLSKVAPKLNELTSKESSLNAFSVISKNTGVFNVVDDYCVPYSVKAPFYAIGSGRDHALGALEAGATAVEAVQIAIKLDISCGGSIQTLSFK